MINVTSLFNSNTTEYIITTFAATCFTSMLKFRVTKEIEITPTYEIAL